MKRAHFRWLVMALVLLWPGLPASGQDSRPARPKSGGKEASPPQGGSAEWLSGIAVRVNRDVITKAEVWEEIGAARLAGLSKEQRARLFDAKLNELILKKINDQAVAKVQLLINRFDTREYIENQKEMLGGEEAYNAMLNEQGFTEEDYVDRFVAQTRRTYYIRSLAGALGPVSPEVRPEFNIHPSASEIRAYYKRHLKDEFTVGREVSLRFLSVRFAAYGRDESSGALAVARKARRDLSTGADFRTLARRIMRSEDEDVGRLITIGGAAEESLPPPVEVEEYAWKGPVGEVSEPIPYRRGYYLVRVESRRPERVLAFGEVQYRIREKLKRERERQAEVRVQRRLLERSYIYPEFYKTRLLAGR